MLEMDESSAILLFYYALFDYTLQMGIENSQEKLTSIYSIKKYDLYIGASSIFNAKYYYTEHDISYQQALKMVNIMSVLLNNGFFLEYYNVQVICTEDKEKTSFYSPPETTFFF